VCPLRVFRVYNKVADSGGVVIEEQGFSIIDTLEPAIAMPLSPFCLHPMDFYLHRNQIFLVGRHQEVCRIVLPGLHHIKSVSSHCGMLHSERHTTVVGLIHRSPATILCHCKRSEWQSIRVDIPGHLGHGGDARAVLEMVGRSDEGHAF
jgi:hypothetical protein